MSTGAKRGGTRSHNGELWRGDRAKGVGRQWSGYRVSTYMQGLVRNPDVRRGAILLNVSNDGVNPDLSQEHEFIFARQVSYKHAK